MGGKWGRRVAVLFPFPVSLPPVPPSPLDCSCFCFCVSCPSHPCRCGCGGVAFSVCLLLLFWNLCRAVNEPRNPVGGVDPPPPWWLAGVHQAFSHNLAPPPRFRVSMPPLCGVHCVVCRPSSLSISSGAGPSSGSIAAASPSRSTLLDRPQAPSHREGGAHMQAP